MSELIVTKLTFISKHDPNVRFSMEISENCELTTTIEEAKITETTISKITK